MKKYIIIIFLLLLISFIFLKFFSMDAHKPQNVTFTTKDDVKIVGNFYPQRGNLLRRTVLFLHMMPATKESWDALARELQKKDVASLTIDLRGHGQSTRMKNKDLGFKKLDYLNFMDEEHQKSILDVEAALEWLDKKNGGMPISIVGASIGANLALEALAWHSRAGDFIPQAALLSPGLSYRGIEAMPFVASLLPDQSVFYATSKDDGDDAKQVQDLYNNTKAQKTIKVYDNAGHGTDMLEKTDLLPILVEFLTSQKD